MNHLIKFLSKNVFFLNLVPILLWGQSTSIDTTVIKSGRRPNYQFKSKNSTFSNQIKGKSPFNYYSNESLKKSIQVNKGKVVSQEKIGKSSLSNQSFTQFSDFNQQQNREVNRSFWSAYSKSLDGDNSMKSRGLFPKIELPPSIDRIFGGSEISIKPNGSLLLDVGYMSQFVDNPAVPIQLRRISNLYFNEQAQFNFQGKIGDKLNLNTNFDTKASFNFQNQLKLNWKTQEEDILQNIEVGNTSWTLNSQLIPGVQNLFGIKTLMRFGNLDVTLVAAQQRSKQDCINLKGGTQGRGYEIRAEQYDENRNFFLSKYFRDNYEKNLRKLPVILSGVQITRVEVYVTNRTQNTETLRNLAALYDIDKQSNNAPAANNESFTKIVQNSERKANEIAEDIQKNFPSYQRGLDFDIIRGAKRLSEREFKFHPQLGYISLIAPLRNDEVLAVAYEYTVNGRKYKVGELTEDYQASKDDQVIFLKLLKSSTLRNQLKESKGKEMWDLMMKNIYSLNTNAINKQGFQLKIVYKDDKTGIDNTNMIEGIGIYKDVPWVEGLGFDKLNFAGDSQKDGNYDFVDEITIDSKNGKIIFPVLEPFSSNFLKSKVDVNKYGFDELYTNTMTDAAQVTTKNKFFIKGSYQSGIGGDISLPFGVDPKSVTVTAGGQSLSQGSDFMVDPTGKVKIINESVFNSGREIRVCYEKPDLFSNQVRTLLGTRLDYFVSKDMRLGATVQNMSETPPAFFRRVAIGNEPVNNTLLGVDASFVKKSNFITNLFDKLPFVSTKEASIIDFQGEYAKLIPNVNDRVQGNAFIDDFEATRVIYNFNSNPTAWKPGSVPEDYLRSNSLTRGNLESNFNRAKISAYTVDASIYGQGSFGISVPGVEDVSSFAYERSVSPKGLFPGKDFANNITGLPLGVLDVSYFPSERGIYNFNPNLKAQNGLVVLNQNPKKNFGVITRAITSDTDFENANVETLEFWLMDPFISGEAGRIRDGNTNPLAGGSLGGKLTFHLGDVSEDFIPDSYSNFENGIPSNEILQKDVNYYDTKFGIAPKRQFVINAFDNSGRDKQDVGLDGLPNNSSDNSIPSELTKFSDYLNKITDGTAKSISTLDPANDDYQFYLDEKLNTKKASIIERYKNYMGLEKNSPNTDNPNSNNVSQANTVQPDREDLNNDNTVNEVENYYSYEIDLQKNTLDNNKYVVDKVNDGNATWYLFRIPLKENYPGKSFKSIRFMRMMLSEFSDPVILRFAQLQLSGYSYRKFVGNLDKTGGINNEAETDPETKFIVGTANIEENSVSAGNAIPYIVPPGFVRDQDITTINNARLNEQSLSLKVENLKNGKSRAVFKNTIVDMLNYKRLKMFVSMQEHPITKQGDLSKAAVFMRLGTDVTDNYYEIVQTNLTLAKKSAVDVDVWPLENEFDIDLDLLKKAKTARNSQQGRGYQEKYRYEIPNSNYVIYVRGNPDLSAVMNVVIGVKNQGSEVPLNFNVWFDELRTNGFDQTSGDAAIGKMAIKLADLGTVNLNGAFKNYGFGGVQTKISERSRDNNIEYGISASLSLERFLPKSWNLKIPFYITYDRKNISPKFDPFDPDIFLENSIASLQNFKGGLDANNLRLTAEDNTVRSGYNFSNVRKIRSNTAKHNFIWDLSNFTFNYAFSEMIRTSPLMADFRQSSYKGGFIYSYSAQTGYVEPFKKLKGTSNFAPLIRDINFNLVPSSISVRMDMDRSFLKTQMRDETFAAATPQFEKYWYFNRQYALNWNLTKSIVANYSAMANSIIDEPFGEAGSEKWKDSVMINIRNLGRTKSFDQQAGFVYRLPLQKTPLTDWMNLDYSHKINFNYMANSFDLRDDAGNLFGNIIKNGRDRTVTGKVDFVSLYNRIRALRWASSPKYYSKDVARSPGDDEELEIPQKNVAKSLTRLLLTLRGIQVNYSINESTTLPGFLPNSGVLGMNGNWGAPGFDFVSGSQDFGILDKAKAGGWLTKSKEQNIPFTQISNQRFTYVTQLEPNKDLKIQVEGNYTRGDNYQEFFRPDSTGVFQHQSPIRSGNYSMSFLSFMTAFKDPNVVFENFRQNRSILLERLQAAYKNTMGNEGGIGEYNINSQDVLVPAFFASYSGLDPRNVKFSPFYDLPLPNWRVDYNGLNIFPFISKKFSSFSLNHSYTSTYSVGNFVSSLDYGSFYNDYLNLTLKSLLYPLSTRFEQKQVMVEGTKVTVNTLIPVYVMSTLTFTERFAPLIGFNAVTKSKVSLRFEYAQDRSVGLNLSNSQVAELSNKDLTVSIGFTKANLTLPITVNGKKVKLPNDLRFNCNLTIRDTRTLQRKLDAETIVTQGFINFQFRPQISYNVNNKLSVTAYFDKMFNNPLVSNSFYRSTVAGGFQIRYSLSE
ncbi:T9SS outer membrane translocon Sov/SprA [Sandaracinomonas limnophila]|uniref:T9SS outer membrane translocon Sov/SprA n=1 Tax=Sandaracinomonas limnophila TaxID=1862386 RepID=UPI0013E3E7E8|nr:cell surface protein SprA [Sandaracinomonas limnophila]